MLVDQCGRLTCMACKRAGQTPPMMGGLGRRDAGTDSMGTASIAELLAAWRAADRRSERHTPSLEIREAALEVVAASVACQDAAMPVGYRPEELIGRAIGDLAAHGECRRGLGGRALNGRQG